MTLSINGNDLSEIIQVAAVVGSIVAMLLAGLIVYLIVRPPRHVRQRRKAERRGEIGPEMEPGETQQLWRLVDRMELRLEVLERALADQVDRPAIGASRKERILTPVEDRDSGRTE